MRVFNALTQLVASGRVAREQITGEYMYISKVIGTDRLDTEIDNLNLLTSQLRFGWMNLVGRDIQTQKNDSFVSFRSNTNDDYYYHDVRYLFCIHTQIESPCVRS